MTGPRTLYLDIEPLDQRFWELVDILAPNGCMEWRGAVNPDGYGVIRRVPFRGNLAHRASYRDYHSTPIEGMVVRHKCDNRTCVNPAHLELGTQRDNVRDMDERGRRTVLRRATGHGRAKYDQADIDAILAAPPRRVKAIALAIGMPISTAYTYRYQKGSARRARS